MSGQCPCRRATQGPAGAETLSIEHAVIRPPCGAKLERRQHDRIASVSSLLGQSSLQQPRL